MSISNTLSNKVQNQTVALIDDDLGTRAQLADYLGGNGFSIKVFDSAIAACDFLVDGNASVVITDLRLPEMSGLDLLRFVNQLDSPMPVILMSGIGNVSDVVQALRLGAADYLIKPILDFDVVVHSVENALEVVALKRENEAYRVRLETMNRKLTDHVQLLERDQQAAKQVQGNLLPITPVTYYNIELSHLVLPSLYLSGDFVDYGCLHQRYIAFYLTDVSGHGASSAFVTVWLKQLVRRLFREKQLFQSPSEFTSAPAELLTVINRELMQSRFFSHMTSVAGLIDVETREMSYVLAGHLPLPILISPSGDAVFLEGKGKPLGLFEDAIWTVNTVKLPRGFKLVMFSDGILEMLPGSGMIEREAILLERLQGFTEAASVAAIADRIGLDVGQEAPDDIALMLAQDFS